MANKNTSKTVSEQLREYIAGSSMSRYEIAKRSGVDASQLHRFMNGTGSLKTDSSFDAVAAVLGVTLTKGGDSDG